MSKAVVIPSFCSFYCNCRHLKTCQLQAVLDQFVARMILLVLVTRISNLMIFNYFEFWARGLLEKVPFCSFSDDNFFSNTGQPQAVP